jgi:hypothetical protein
MKSLRLSLFLLLILVLGSTAEAQQSITPGTPNNQLTADADFVDFAVPLGTGSLTITLTGTFVSTNRVDVTAFNNNWQAGTFTQSVPVIDASDNSSDTTITVPGSWVLGNPGWVRFRVYASDWISGTVNVFATRSEGASTISGGSTGTITATGFSTEVKQDTEITLANSMNMKLDTIDSIDFATQATSALMLTSLQLLDNAVAGNEFQVDVLTMPTVTVTANNLDIQSGGLDLVPALTSGSSTAGQPGALILAAATSAPPSYTTGQTNPISMDLAGNVRVNCIAGCGGVAGGTSQADNSALASITGGGALYDLTPPTITDGNVGLPRMDASRYQYAVFPSAQSVTATNAFALDATLTTIFGADVIFSNAGTPDTTEVLAVQGATGMTPLAANITMVNGAALSAANPLYTYIISNGGSTPITIPDAKTQNFDTDGGTSITQIFGVAIPDPAGAVSVDAAHPFPTISTSTSQVTTVGFFTDEGAFTKTSSKITGFGALAESTNDTLADDLIGAPVMTINRQLRIANSADDASAIATSACYLVSAASTNATNCKSTAGNLYGARFINTTATVYFLRLYNTAAAPTCSSATGFIESIPIPASTTGAGFMWTPTYPINYTTGIGYCFTAGGGSTDNTNAATGVYGAIQYK